MRVKKSESKRDKQCESKREKEKDVVRQKEINVDGKGEREKTEYDRDGK